MKTQYKKIVILGLLLIFTPLSFAKCNLDLWVIVSNEGIPQEVVNAGSTPQQISTKLHKGSAKRRQTICWRSYEVDPNDPKKYRRANWNIAIIWSPLQNIKFERVVKQKIARKTPLNIEFKYSVATRASKPDEPSMKHNKLGVLTNPTYLDPIIIIKK